MNKLLTLLCLFFSFLLKAQEFEDILFNSYEKYKVDGFSQRRTAPQLVYSELQRQNNNVFKVRPVSTSIEGKPIYLVSAGRGETSVLLWSQMHGNESTATRALMDVFEFFQQDDELNAFRETLLSSLNLHFVPMLNPDGGKKWQRRNRLGVDINRDALRLQSPESQILKKLRDSLQAEFGYNLHDQSRYYNAEFTSKPATISFLATAYNEEKSINENRAKSMRLVLSMNEVLQKFAPGHVGRYSDDFEPRAFGDNIQLWGTSLVLIESGGYFNDREKEFIRKLNFVIILSSLHEIATKKYAQYDIDDYEKIPRNDRKMFDLKIVNLNYPLLDKMYLVDMGINQNEIEDSSENRFSYSGALVDFGDLSTYYGYETFDAEGYTYLSPKTYSGSLKDISEWDLLKQGYAFKTYPHINGNYIFKNVILNRIKDGKSYSDASKKVNFFLKKDDTIKFAVINGFLIDIEKQKLPQGFNAKIE